MIPQEQLHDRTALILYGSETGNAQEVAEEMGRITERLRFSTHVAEFDSMGLVNASTACTNRFSLIRHLEWSSEI